MTPELQAKLDEIVPGKNYVTAVEITEKIPKLGETTLRFLFASYVVGMYSAIYNEKTCVFQGVARSSRAAMKNFKLDLIEADKRGAKVEITGSILPLAKAS